MGPPGRRAGLRRYYRVKDARATLDIAEHICSEDANNPSRPGSKVFWVGPLIHVYNAAVQAPTSFYEVLGAGNVVFYGDVDLKVDPPLPEEPDGDLLKCITQAKFSEADLHATTSPSRGRKKPWAQRG